MFVLNSVLVLTSVGIVISDLNGLIGNPQYAPIISAQERMPPQLLCSSLGMILIFTLIKLAQEN